MLQFIVGAVAATVAIWLWGEDLRRYAGTGTRAVRNRAVDTMQVVEDKAGNVLDTAKEQVHSTFQAGKDAVRPKGF